MSCVGGALGKAAVTDYDVGHVVVMVDPGCC